MQLFPNPSNVFYAGEIGEKFLEALWSAQDRLVFQSEGGCAHSMCAALDMLAQKKLLLVGTGMIMSAAVPILANGDVRACTARTRFLVHPIRSFGFRANTAKDSEQEAEELRWLEKRYIEALAAGSKKNEKFWTEKCADDEFYFDAETALRLGVVDEVL